VKQQQKKKGQKKDFNLHEKINYKFFTMILSIIIVSFFSFSNSSIAVTIPTNDDTNLQQQQRTPTTTTTTNNEKLLKKNKYWTMIESGDMPSIKYANEHLIDHAVGIITTMYYDNSAGLNFSPKDFYNKWRVLKIYANNGIKGLKEEFPKNNNSVNLFIQDSTVQLSTTTEESTNKVIPPHAFNTRDDAVSSIKWLVSTVGDPYSKYLTREELKRELQVKEDGFLGLGIIVEPPPPSYLVNNKKQTLQNNGLVSGQDILSFTRVANLPVVTAVVPDSPAERGGIAVGDKFVTIGSDKLLGLGRNEIVKKLRDVYTGAENYVGYPYFTLAKPILRDVYTDVPSSLIDNNDNGGEEKKKEELVGYKLSSLRLPTISMEQPFKPYSPSYLKDGEESKNNSITPTDSIIKSSSKVKSDLSNNNKAIASSLSSSSRPNKARRFVSGGDAIVHYELLTPNDSIFRQTLSPLDDNETNTNNSGSNNGGAVGYIRLTRFSRSSTQGFIHAIKQLETAGAESYIIDVRNNYGGVIQESMLSSSMLLRDPRMVLCYIINSQGYGGGVIPVDVEQYITDERYPGYLLSKEDSSVVLRQVKNYKSKKTNQIMKKKKIISSFPLVNVFEDKITDSYSTNKKNIKKRTEEEKKKTRKKKQKNIVLLVNEGTASAAEVFVSSLHDNGRTVALVGTRTYGKGLIQHTFPMPDGGGLRLTVAEYLTPTLQHVTKVGNARYDPWTGDFIKGGIKPDVYCPSKQGIP